jgi:Lrp/AsnC family leucine-responsive transcriptional regulator
MASTLDRVDATILALVQSEARLSFREISRRVGMSTPAVAERIRRLEATGVITGYAARVDRAALGCGIGAFVNLSVADQDFHRVEGLCRSLDAVVECHHVTGDDSFVIRLSVATLPELEDVLARFRKIGRARSTVILSSPVDGKPARPSEDGVVAAGNPR